MKTFFLPFVAGALIAAVAPNLARAGDPPPPAMRFENACEIVGKGPSLLADGDFSIVLNQRSREGWEVVSVATILAERKAVVCFKRPVAR